MNIEELTLSDKDLEDNDWYIIVEDFFISPISMYGTIKKIKLRILTQEKPRETPLFTHLSANDRYGWMHSAGVSEAA